MRFFRRKRFQNDITDFFQYDNWWKYVINRIMGNGARYIGGDDVDLYKAFYSTTFACIDRRSKAVAGTGWKLLTNKPKSARSKTLTKKDKDRIFSLKSLSYFTKAATDVEEIIDHPLLDRIWEVSDIENEYTLFYGTTAYQDLLGDAFWYVPKGEDSGLPIEINFIQPQFMTPVLKKIDGKPSGIVDYYQYKRGEEKIRYEVDEIVHYKYFNLAGGVKGFPPTRAAAESINLDHDMVTFLFDTLSNRLRQEMLLTSEGQLSPDSIKAIQGQMDEYRKAKKDKMPILPGNLKAVPLSGTVKDLPFVQNRKLEREQICMSFGVPANMVTQQSSEAEREAAEMEFCKYTVAPLCIQFQQQLNQSFVPMYDDESLFIMFDDPVPENRQLDLAEAVGYVGAGIWNINEVRADQNREAVENGDTNFMPSNLIPLGATPDQQARAFVDAIDKELERRGRK